MADPQSVVAAMGDILSPAEIPVTDKTLLILDQLFGSGWNNPAAMMATAQDAPTSSLLLAVFYAFNSVAMMIGAVLLGWIMMQGIIGTAHEGKALGQKMHSIWAPIRAGVSISMLAPVVKGFCALQLICLICIAGSVNFANNLWYVGLDFLDTNHGMITQMQVPHELQENTRSLAKGILQSLAISYYQEYYHEKEMPSPKYTQEWKPNLIHAVQNGDRDGHWQIKFLAPIEEAWIGGIDDDDMGEISIPSDGTKSTLSTVRLNGIMEMIETLSPLAQAIVLTTHPGYEDVPIPKGLIEIATTKYNQTIAEQIPTILTDGDSKYQENLSAFVESAKSDGWFMAGSYYWNIAGYADQVHKVAKNFPTYSEGNKKLLAEFSDTDLETVLKSVLLVTDQVKEKMAIARGSVPSGDSAVMRKLTEITRTVFGGLTIDKFAAYLADGDPIANLANLGHMIIGVAQAGVVTAITAKALVDVSDSDNLTSILANMGSGGITKAITAGLASAVGMLVPLIMLAMIPVVLLGVTLAFYLPALPFITWVVAVVGWIILVLETMFAAPLWAIAHAMPEGEGIAGQHGRQGYMLLLGVLVRPPLMVAGFLCAIVLMPVVGKYIGYAFLVFSSSMSANHLTGIVTVLAMMFIIGSLYVLLAHKIFKLVTHLPETVTKWVGQQVQNLGEEGDETRTRNMFAAGVSKAEGVGNNSMRGGSGTERKPNSGGKQDLKGSSLQFESGETDNK